MTGVWITVTAVGVGTILLKGLGPAVLGGRSLPRALVGPVSVLAPALLAALVVTNAFTSDDRLVLDERAFGLAMAAVAIRLKAPVLVVVVLAAATTALARAFA
jgi:branched-subunit amino acid transport protein